MLKKVTPQEVLDAYNLATTNASPESQEFFAPLPERLEDLTDRQQAIFQGMAFKMNCITGEMCVEEKQ
jgi:hypothetical protein